MGTWVLIISLSLAISGYKSEAECQAAAKIVNNQVGRSIAICVPTTLSISPNGIVRP